MSVHLKLLYWNPGGVKQHFSQLRSLVQEQDIHVVLLGETKLRESEAFRLPNYCVYRRDEISPQGMAYRGTAVAVRRDVVHTVLDDSPFTVTRTKGAELWVEGRPLRLYAAYRPPGPLYDPQDIDTILDGRVPTIIAGDLNAKHTVWGSRVVNSTGGKLLKHAEETGFEVLGPEAPTHIPSNPRHRPDVLDIVLARNVFCPILVDVLWDTNTQHLPVLVTLCVGAERLQIPKVRRVTDWEVFQAKMANLKLNACLNSPVGVDAAANNVTIFLQQALAAATTEQAVSYKREPLPVRIRELKKRKRELRKLWAHSRCPDVKHDLNACAEKLSVEMSKYRGASWEARINEASDNQTSLHHLNRQLTRTRPPTCPLINPTGGLTYPAQDRAQILAECMREQFTPHEANAAAREHHERVERRVSEFISGPTPSLEGVEFISPSETRKVVSRLKRRKAPGQDNIPSVALVMLPKRALVTVTRLFNGILRTGHFPTIWKTGKVIALPKVGKDHRIPTNYRPITLLATLAKLFERLLRKRMQPLLNIRDEQFGFRGGHSTTLQLTRVIHHLSDELNNGRHTVGVFLDIEKAFDRVWHPGLIYKLLDTPVPAMLVKLIASFLEGRQFFISVESRTSDLKPIYAGVPQGSCLSPMLYSLYTNDIPTLEGSRQDWERDVMLALFADDSAYFASSRRAELAATKMQRVLDVLPTWLDKWRMAVNVGKTVATLFSRKRIMPPPLRLRDQEILWQSQAKYLGCYIDRSVRMTWQVEHALRQTRAARAMLRPVLTSRLPTKTKLGIYYTYVRSRMTYAAPAWYASASNTARSRLQAQQNIALRVIVGAGRYVRNDVLARDLRVPTLERFVALSARRMYDRADNGTHPHLKGIAPLHARPPEGRPLPRELKGLVSSSDSSSDEEDDS